MVWQGVDTGGICMIRLNIVSNNIDDLIVTPFVEGSNPFSHPIFSQYLEPIPVNSSGKALYFNLLWRR